MLRPLIALALALTGAGATAQSCLTNLTLNGVEGSPLYSGITRNGAWVRWYCYDYARRQIARVAYVGTLPELSKVGARVQTIMKAADPLKSLQTAGSRFPILPLTDPSLAAIVADMEAVK